jgi:hypothetical protein
LRTSLTGIALRTDRTGAAAATTAAHVGRADDADAGRDKPIFGRLRDCDRRAHHVALVTGRSA